MRWPREHDFNALIAVSAAKYGVPIPFIKATIGVESGFNPMALNTSDPGFAWGLMQMIPATAKGLGYTGLMSALRTDPALAIDLGAKLLGQNLIRTGGAVADSASAYNGGFRPSLGFGQPRADGTYANQAYVTKILDAFRYFGGSTAPAGGGEPGGAPSFPNPGGCGSGPVSSEHSEEVS